MVCTANVCRSPSVAALLTAALGSEVDVLSAGSRADTGAPVCPAALAWAARWLPPTWPSRSTTGWPRTGPPAWTARRYAARI